MTIKLPKDYLEMSINQLELVLRAHGPNAEVFILYKDHKIVGWELKSDNKEWPTVVESNETGVVGLAVDLYIDYRTQLLNIPEICSKLRAVRIAKNLEQKEVAELIGKTKQEVHRWENKVVAHDDMINDIIDLILKYNK